MVTEYTCRQLYYVTTTSPWSFIHSFISSHRAERERRNNKRFGNLWSVTERSKIELRQGSNMNGWSQTVSRFWKCQQLLMSPVREQVQKLGSNNRIGAGNHNIITELMMMMMMMTWYNNSLLNCKWLVILSRVHSSWHEQCSYFIYSSSMHTF